MMERKIAVLLAGCLLSLTAMSPTFAKDNAGPSAKPAGAQGVLGFDRPVGRRVLKFNDPIGQSTTRLQGKPFYGQAKGQLRLNCTSPAERAQAEGRG